jgi:hypothetical protein
MKLAVSEHRGRPRRPPGVIAVGTDIKNGDELGTDVENGELGSGERVGTDIKIGGVLSWRDAVHGMLSRLDKQVLVYTSLGVNCGIATYSQALYANQPRVAFAGSWSDTFAMARLLTPRVIHIHHEHGLHYDEDEFVHTLSSLKRRHQEASIFVTLHTVHASEHFRSDTRQWAVDTRTLRH